MKSIAINESYNPNGDIQLTLSQDPWPCRHLHCGRKSMTDEIADDS